VTERSIPDRSGANGDEWCGISYSQLREDARVRRPLLAFHAIKARVYRLLRSPNHFLHAIWLEIRSLSPRISLLRSMMSGKSCLRVGYVWEIHPTQPLQPNRRTNTCIRDIALLEEKVPWVSPVELHFFLLGWNMGEKWCRSIADSCSEQQADIPPA
jgi:hypothetical protein